MFSKPPAKGAFGDRLRKVAERKAPSVAREAPRKQEERPQRRALFRQGFVLLPTGQKLRVAIKNLSESGARVEFFTQEELPDVVLLSEPTLKLRRRARVVWQRDGIAGLKFTDR